MCNYVSVKLKYEAMITKLDAWWFNDLYWVCQDECRRLVEGLHPLLGCKCYYIRVTVRIL